MGERNSARSGDAGSEVHDRLLAFARERGLAVRPAPGSGDLATIELPKGELLIGVTFKNGPQPDGRWEWFVTARDARTSEQLWAGRFDYDMWFDFFGDASNDLSAEEADDRFIAFLDAVSTNEVRLSEVEKKPLFRLPGWRRPNGTKTELQLLIDGEWHGWDGSLGPVLREERPLRRPS